MDGKNVGPMGYEEGGELGPIAGDGWNAGGVTNSLLDIIPLPGIGPPQGPGPEVRCPDIVRIYRRRVRHLLHLHGTVDPYRYTSAYGLGVIEHQTMCSGVTRADELVLGPV